MRLREPYTFFVDRSLGGKVVPKALRDAGLAVEVHDDHFPQNTPDEVWIPHVGKNQWVLLTKDPRIRTNAVERTKLLEGKVAAFMLGRGDLTGVAMAEIFLRAHDLMFRALRRFDVAMIASVSMDATVTVLYAASERLVRPVQLKPRRTHE